MYFLSFVSRNYKSKENFIWCEKTVCCVHTRREKLLHRKDKYENEEEAVTDGRDGKRDGSAVLYEALKEIQK